MRELPTFQPWVFAPESAFPPGYQITCLQVVVNHLLIPTPAVCRCGGDLRRTLVAFCFHHSSQAGRIAVEVYGFPVGRCEPCQSVCRIEKWFDRVEECARDLMRSVIEGRNPLYTAFNIAEAYLPIKLMPQ